MLKSINNKRLSSKNNIYSNSSNSSNNISKKNIKHAGKHTFFTTDSEDTDEDISKIKEEIEPKVSEKKKKAKKRDKEFNEISEFKTELVKVESEYNHDTNNISLNGELMNNEESELSDSKSKIEKKFKIKSSPSWVNEYDETFVDNSPGNYLKPENDTSEIKVEYNTSDNESILADKSMIKKKSMKRKSDGTSKRDSKKIKSEQFDDTYEYTYDDWQESPTKQYKNKESVKLETSESEEITTKRHSKKSNISDSQVVFENVKIKKERLTSGSENSQEENYVTISKTLKNDPDACSSTYDTQDENNTPKKKRKKHSKNAIIDTSTIKVEFDEHEFKNFTIKEENFGSNEDVTEDIYSKHVKNVSKSPRKKHNISLNDCNTYDDEVNTNTTKRSKKKVNEDIIDSGEIKLEKFSTTDNSDIDNSNFQSTEKRKKHKKKLSTELNKSRDIDHESEFDFNDEVKTERFSEWDI